MSPAGRLAALALALALTLSALVLPLRFGVVSILLAGIVIGYVEGRTR